MPSVAQKLYRNSLPDDSGDDQSDVDPNFNPDDYDWSKDKNGKLSGSYNAKKAEANAAKKRTPAEQKAYEQMQKDVDEEMKRQQSDPTGKFGS